MENTIPTDSVLRRHYEATHGKETKPETEQTSNSGGFMCWLKKFFTS